MAINREPPKRDFSNLPGAFSSLTETVATLGRWCQSQADAFVVSAQRIFQPLSEKSAVATHRARTEWGKLVDHRRVSPPMDPTMSRCLKGMLAMREETMELANLPDLAAKVDAIVGRYIEQARSGGEPSEDWRPEVANLVNGLDLIPHAGQSRSSIPDSISSRYLPGITLNPLVNEAVWTTAEIDIIVALGSKRASEVQARTGKNSEFVLVVAA